MYFVIRLLFPLQSWMNNGVIVKRHMKIERKQEAVCGVRFANCQFQILLQNVSPTQIRFDVFAAEFL